jgi:Malic enzyme, N-terminal domain
MATTPRGTVLLRDPRFNKSTAFTEAEREALGLVGLVPEGIDSEETQIQRVLLQLGQKPTDLEKYIFLSQLQDADETLFYRLLMSDPAHFLPLVYTPTVGEACLQFGHIIRRPKGLYVSIKRKGHVRDILRNWPEHDIRFMVVTSGQLSLRSWLTNRGQATSASACSQSARATFRRRTPLAARSDRPGVLPRSSDPPARPNHRAHFRRVRASSAAGRYGNHVPRQAPTPAS